MYNITDPTIVDEFDRMSPRTLNALNAALVGAQVSRDYVRVNSPRIAAIAQALIAFEANERVTFEASDDAAWERDVYGDDPTGGQPSIY